MAATQSLPAPVVEARALLERAAGLIEDTDDNRWAWASYAAQSLAEALETPESGTLQAAAYLLQREDGGDYADDFAAAMREVAGLVCALGTVVARDSDARDALKLHYHLDAIQQRLIAIGRELAEDD